MSRLPAGQSGIRVHFPAGWNFSPPTMQDWTWDQSKLMSNEHLRIFPRNQDRQGYKLDHPPPSSTATEEMYGATKPLSCTSSRRQFSFPYHKCAVAAILVMMYQ
jgi:hypothetical protein